MSPSPISIARSLHAALEAGKHGEELRPFFTADAVTIEHPNALKAAGATTDLEKMLSASAVGAAILAKQSYDVHSTIEQGSLAILRLTWTGEIARDVGPFRKGQVLTAHIAQFIETRDGRVARIETYDCYEPFDAQGPAPDTASNLSTPSSATKGSITSHVYSADGVRISYERTGSAPTALVFVHGWLGSSRWWDAQRDAFSPRFTVVQLDLADHGASSRERTSHSAEAYASDITAVVNALHAERVVLVGHSMSGAYALLAALSLPRTAALILVDTLKNVEQVLPAAQVNEMLALYRRDFRTAVERVLPQWLFARGTPPEVSARLQREFLERTGDAGAALLEPLYRFDVRSAAAQLKVPVRAINSDLQPTDVEANRRHFRDYAVRLIPGAGHYPMLEAPAAFNAALHETLTELKLLF
jgi:pimeloyl-ACP methyl ester carboxylesterase